jgi:hypothetical protein
MHTALARDVKSSFSGKPQTSRYQNEAWQMEVAPWRATLREALLSAVRITALGGDRQ